MNALSIGGGDRIFSPNIHDCRRFLCLFWKSSTARQYVIHVTHAFNRMGITAQNLFRSEPCKQMFRGLIKRELAQGGGPKPKPVLTLEMVKFLILALALSDPQLSCLIALAFCFGSRVNSELIPVQWGVGGHSVLTLHFRDNDRPFAKLVLASRKNYQGGSTIYRACMCSHALWHIVDLQPFHHPNPICPVHAPLKYFKSFPERFVEGAFLFPSHLRGKKSCSTRALSLSLCGELFAPTP